MALLKKALSNISEKCGCGDDENSGTALLSFLVRRNQAEEEEQLDAVRMVGDKKPDTDMDDAVDVDGEERGAEMDMEMDPDAEGEVDVDMEIDPDMGDEEMDPDAEGEMDDEHSDPMVGDEMDPDGEMALGNEQDPEKRLSILQKLLSNGK